MKNNGYTIPELVGVVVFLGIVSFFMISKGSYAFENADEESNQSKELILEKSASLYGESIKESLKLEKTKYLLARDLVDAGYLVDDDIYEGAKIKLDYIEETDSISVKIIK